MKQQLFTTEYVGKILKMRLSNKNLANLGYALFACRAAVTRTWMLGEGYDRKQVSTFHGDAVISIHPKRIEMFEEIMGIKLSEPEKISLR